MKKIIIWLFIFFGVYSSSFALDTWDYWDFYYDDINQTISYNWWTSYSLANKADSFISFYRTDYNNQQLTLLYDTWQIILWVFDDLGNRVSIFWWPTSWAVTYYHTTTFAACVNDTINGNATVYANNDQNAINWTTCQALGYTEPLTWKATIDYIIYDGAVSFLNVLEYWTITNLENWVEITWLETNKDFFAEYEITKWDWTANYYQDSWVLWSFSWWINNISIFYDFLTLWEYNIILTITDLEDSLIEYNLNYAFTYSFDWAIIDPEANDFSFFVSWYTFFENWFSLNNFVPDPYWWELYFELIWPAETWSWRINITTETFWPKEQDGSGYWYDTSVIVTLPYHQYAWTYEVRTVYKYLDLIIYPFWETYNTYNITLPEQYLNFDFSSIDGLEWNFFQNVWSFLNNIKSFFSELMKIWKVEPREWGFNFFIPTTHAEWLVSDTIVFSMDTQESNILTNFFSFLKWFIVFAFLIISVILVIVLLKKD